MRPFASAVNRTPSSIALGSFVATCVGVTDGGQIVQQTAGAPSTLMDTPLAGRSTLPRSSVARLRIVVAPPPGGIQAYVQLARPVACLHVRPPSTETSTPATWPPVSVAVPLIVTMGLAKKGA